jgi:transposase
VRRRLREAGLSFKRVVKRPLNTPEPEAYERCKKHLAKLERREERGEIELAYADAAGFSLQASQAMAWQHPQHPLHLTAHDHRKRWNVFGFLRKNNAFEAVVFDQTINDDCVIAAIDHYIRHRTKDSLGLHLVIDNAPSHHNNAMLEAQERWKRKKVFIEYLTPYSPHLNRIEILWRRVKYHWLPLCAYQSMEDVRRCLFAVLNSIGTKYHIIFEN